MDNCLTSDVKCLKGVGSAKALLLAKLGIFSVGDLLEHYPARYEDRRQLKKIRELFDDQLQTFQARVVTVEEFKPRSIHRRRMTVTKAIVEDGTGFAEIVWFNQPYKKRNFKPGNELIVSGKIEKNYGKIQITKNIEIEFLDGTDLLHTRRIVPVYPATDNLNQHLLRALIRQSLAICDDFPELLPREIIEQYNLVSRKTALTNIHFPEDWDLLAKARRRLAFEELYFLQCSLLYLKRKNKEQCIGIRHSADKQLSRQLERNLPFTLTDDQKQALREIKADMESVKPMQRLLQGDVGSGKTIIAAIALMKTVENGYQGAMMAPTEILAEQHYQTLCHLYDGMGLNIALLTGKLIKRNRDSLLQNIKTGLINIVVGTHALIQEDVEFKTLGLVVTDEQHRFGVQQRVRLQAKGNLPDVLVMTATPIPRTMALTVYGDLDISVIRQLPPGRKQIKTYAVGEELRQRVYTNLVLKEIAQGRQAYIVCPLVDESEKLEAVAAVQLYEDLTKTIFKAIRCGLIHGRMKPHEKESVMNEFYHGNIKVLIATTVIEVGVNVPNATVMVVEGADRFGLAQLHQLRGRIGRGEHPSYCVLITANNSDEAQERLKIMTQSQDGFLLSEKDLLLRGPGQFFGTRQHGIPDLKIADIIKDLEILIQARQAACQTIQNPEQFHSIVHTLQRKYGQLHKMVFHG